MTLHPPVTVYPSLNVRGPVDIDQNLGVPILLNAYGGQEALFPQLPFHHAFARVYNTEACFVGYTIDWAGATRRHSNQFRAKKILLRDGTYTKWGVGITITYHLAAIDIDRDRDPETNEKRAWRDDAEKAAFRDRILASPLCARSSYFYPTGGGARIVLPLATPITIACGEDESDLEGRLAALRDAVAKSIGMVQREITNKGGRTEIVWHSDEFQCHIDNGCADWTRFFRLPNVTKGGREIRAAVSGDATDPIELLDFEPVGGFADRSPETRARRASVSAAAKARYEAARNHVASGAPEPSDVRWRNTSWSTRDFHDNWAHAAQGRRNGALFLAAVEMAAAGFSESEAAAHLLQTAWTWGPAEFHTSAPTIASAFSQPREVRHHAHQGGDESEQINASPEALAAVDAMYRAQRAEQLPPVRSAISERTRREIRRLAFERPSFRRVDYPNFPDQVMAIVRAVETFDANLANRMAGCGTFGTLSRRLDNGARAACRCGSTACIGDCWYDGFEKCDRILRASLADLPEPPAIHTLRVAVSRGSLSGPDGAVAGVTKARGKAFEALRKLPARIRHRLGEEASRSIIAVGVHTRQAARVDFAPNLTPADIDEHEYVECEGYATGNLYFSTGDTEVLDHIASSIVAHVPGAHVSRNTEVLSWIDFAHAVGLDIRFLPESLLEVPEYALAYLSAYHGVHTLEGNGQFKRRWAPESPQAQVVAAVVDVHRAAHIAEHSRSASECALTFAALNIVSFGKFIVRMRGGRCAPVEFIMPQRDERGRVRGGPRLPREDEIVLPETENAAWYALHETMDALAIRERRLRSRVAS